MHYLLAIKILLILALIIFLICQITVGVDVRYIGGKLTVSAKLCGFLLQLIPRRKATKAPKEKPVEEPEPKKEEKPKKEKKKKKKKKQGPGLMIDDDEVIDLLKKLLEGLGKFSRGINVDRFLLHYTAAGEDPYLTARIFGFVNALLSSLAPVCARRFRCKDPDVWTRVDFTTAEMKLDVGIAVVLRVGAVFAMIFTVLFGAIGILIRNKWRWFILKRKDPEEYAFLVENPSLVTKLIRSVLNKEEKETFNGEPGENEPDRGTDANDNGECEEHS